MTNWMRALLVGAAVSGSMVGTARADDQKTPKAEPGKEAPKAGAEDKHACKGLNTCKGKGGCGAVKGKNECKGKGGCRTDGKPMEKEPAPAK